MQHVFPHQNPYQPDWQHHPHAQSQQHHYAQTQAAAAANAAAQQQQQQQQHYGRIAQNGNSNTNTTMTQALGAGGRELDHSGSSRMNAEQQISEDNRKVLEWIAQVLNPNTREAALLELSKKREQVPELALILWHSFGETRRRPRLRICAHC